MATTRVKIADLMETSGVRFGTSGARGLADDMTDRVCYAYSRAFLQHLNQSGEIANGDVVSIGGDLRPSTPRIMRAVAAAAADAGYQPHGCGLLPSPALCLWGLYQHRATVMVTGSHIPEERNGIKFTKPAGEILKPDEAAIRDQVVDLDDERFDHQGHLLGQVPELEDDDSARKLYLQRYLDFFPSDLLAGRHIGVYQHSAVGRDLLVEIFTGLGARVTPLGRADGFVAVDTEAIRPEDVELGRRWASEYDFDAIVSTDGDSDRPLLADERGEWLRGDVAGILCAAQLGAAAVVTPVSCNSAVEKSGWFETVERTRIGSPYVIEAMQRLSHEHEKNGRIVVGYEANGGFLLQTPIQRQERILAPLPTRDAVIVHLAILERAGQRGKSVSQLLAELPPRFTHSNRLKNFPVERSRAKLAELSTGDFDRDRLSVERVFGAPFGNVASVDTTDGLRITFESAEVVHLRPSGNAPEFRCYTEADSPQRAAEMNRICMEIMAAWR